MPRALKTFITNLGFFELAVAAPSMKAALDAWGMSHNAFQHGFAKQTDDPEIIEATSAVPGVVLKRAVGSGGAFTEDAALPRALPAVKPANFANPRRSRREPKSKAVAPTSKGARAAIISFEKARARRDKERAADEDKLEKRRLARRQEIDKAEAALEDALAEHLAKLNVLDREREKLNRAADDENERWASQRKMLDKAIAQARQK